jgi:epoxyqueuosine reductase
VLGNTGDEADVPLLGAILAEDPDPLLREHAAWALGKLGGPGSERSLRTRFDDEADSAVRYELELSLASLAEPPSGA